MVAVHGRMYTVGGINKKQKALVVGAPILSTTELNTGEAHTAIETLSSNQDLALLNKKSVHAGDTINAYTPQALFLGSARIQRVAYTTAPKQASPNKQDIVFGGTFQGDYWLKVG